MVKLTAIQLTSAADVLVNLATITKLLAEVTKDCTEEENVEHWLWRVRKGGEQPVLPCEKREQGGQLRTSAGFGYGRCANSCLEACRGSIPLR